MIGMTAAVIPHHRANGFRNGVKVLDQILDRFSGEIGMIFKRIINVGDVSLVMLGVMDLHRPRVDMRLEGVVSVGQFR